MNEPKHIELLKEITEIPTAAGREHAVIDRVRAWLSDRPGLEMMPDAFGNLLITREGGLDHDKKPLIVVSHLDHPAFVVEEIGEEGVLRASFRGGVKEPYFAEAPVTVYCSGGGQARGIVKNYEKSDPWGEARIEVQGDVKALGIEIGDIARWETPGAEIDENGDGPALLRTPACDNLASVVAALAMLDELLGNAPESLAHTGVLLTRAEEVGFVGAICACRAGTLAMGSRVLVLENSRSFPDSPIGGGVILRVGDRISVFDNGMSSAIGRLAHEMAERTKDDERPFRWQRKLMPGGACEASVFLSYGYESACLCHPLGNYHNMAALSEVEAGEPSAIEHARCAREFIAIEDFVSMVRILVEAAQNLENAKPLRDRLDEYYETRRFVLENSPVAVQGSE